jgi:hypothetical protein
VSTEEIQAFTAAHPFLTLLLALLVWTMRGGLVFLTYNLTIKALRRTPMSSGPDPAWKAALCCALLGLVMGWYS